MYKDKNRSFLFLKHLFCDIIEHCCLWPTDESERAQAKLKGLDETGPVAMTTKPHKDVNTFINNQLKFVSAPAIIPPDQMKCNILKAQAEKNTGEWSTTLTAVPLWHCKMVS